MNDKNIEKLSENIIKPSFLDDISYSFDFEKMKIPGHMEKYELICKVEFDWDNENMNFKEFFNWINFNIKKFNGSIKLLNWDDTKNFDFELKYKIHLYFSSIDDNGYTMEAFLNSIIFGNS